MNSDLMRVTRGRILTAAACLLFFCAAYISCAPARLPAADLVIQSEDGGQTRIKAELARTEAEHARGLMNRKNLADGEGMLFIFDKDDMYSFWMKNTYIPLSIAFIMYDGRITEIKDMQPRDLASVTSSRYVRYALEVPQGWFERAKIKAGDLVQLDAVR